MKVKKTAKLDGVQPSIYYAIGVADAVYRQHGFSAVCTSLNDSHENRPNSLHNKGLAVDLRTRDIPASTLAIIVRDMHKMLNPIGYDVVLEHDHIHCELDQKEGEQWLTVVA